MTNTAEDNYQEVTKKATKGMGWNFLILLEFVVMVYSPTWKLK